MKGSNDDKWGLPAKKRGTKCPHCEYLGYSDWWPLTDGTEGPYLMSCGECAYVWVDGTE